MWRPSWPRWVIPEGVTIHELRQEDRSGSVSHSEPDVNEHSHEPFHQRECSTDA
jgi:hypothetical protein